MGLRGLHARPVANHPQPLDDQPISPDALRVFRRMRKLELLNCCECPDDTGDPDTMCRNCETLWALNTKLCDFFHLPHWMYAYQIPGEQMCRHDQAALDRYFLLEKAASRAKAQKFKFKWQE
jgi:hypothetical protein